jgi:protein YibB
MSNITIVSAFFDIGRGNWKQNVSKNGGPLPHYLERSAETYIERFSFLCQLENEVIVYTSPEYAPKLEKIKTDLNKQNMTVVPIDFPGHYSDLRAKIEKIQQDPEFLPKINPQQVRNPEYWSPDYVLVTSLKAHFVADAIDRGMVTNEMVAWIDFGYCRDGAALNKTKKWDYDFNPDKIHFFNCKPVDLDNSNAQIGHAVVNNDVIIFGAKVVAAKKFWKPLANNMHQCLDILMESGLVDDDQGLWLMSYFSNPALFELHAIDYNNPFIVFNKFNKYE